MADYPAGVPISEVTRRNLVDEMTITRVNWAGRFDEPDFLARLYNLQEMPSHDRRYSNAYDDIRKHQVMNNDWDDNWVFYDSRFNLLHAHDEELLRFLAETVHPVVRLNPQNAAELVEMYNRHLRVDGYELHTVTDISGKPVYGARSLAEGIPAVNQLRGSSPDLVDHAYLSRQITRMEASIQTDPDLAIGTAKELIETVAKTILDQRNVAYGNSDDMPALLKKVRAELDLTPNDIDAAARGAEIIRKLVNNLASITQSLTELRNLYGTGHGKALGTEGLSSRHARLAVGTAASLATFLLETHNSDDPTRPKSS